MRRPRSSPLHQSGALQNIFDPRIAPVHVVMVAKLLVKMAHVQVVILLPVQDQNLIHLLHRNLAPARLALPLVSYPPKPVLLILPFPPPHGSDADAHYLCRLPPRDLLRHRLQHHFSHSHQSLHFRLGYLLHASSGLELQTSAGQKRPTRVLIHAANSCANDISSACCCWPPKLCVSLRGTRTANYDVHVARLVPPRASCRRGGSLCGT